MGAAWARHAMFVSAFSVHRPAPVAAGFKEWVCGSSLAGNAESNRAGM
jgi:hypothetical protein